MGEEKTKKILIINNKYNDLSIFIQNLGQAGFSVKTTEDIVAGMGYIVKDKPDCLIFDSQMPLASTVNILKKIKNEKQLKSIPVLMLTVTEEEANVLRGLDLGIDDYLEKSTGAEVAIARINALITRDNSEKEITKKEEKVNLELNEMESRGEYLLNKVVQTTDENTELPTRDPLTKLYNREYFHQIVDNEIDRAERHPQNVCCLMIDIDFFKKINDNYGHIFGDKMLIEVAGCINEGLRSVDFLSRYGEDEFAVLLFDIEYNYAFNVAERIRGNVEKYKFEVNGISLALTVSIGISSLFEDGVLDREVFLKSANMILYEAKRKGRNTTVMYKDLSHCVGLEKSKGKEIQSRLQDMAIVSKQRYMEYIEDLINVMEQKEIYSKEHSLNVLKYAVMIAEEKGLTDIEIEVIKNAAILHDLGKTCITDQILYKKGKLTEEEFALVKKHPIIAVNMIQKTMYMKTEIDIILHHHERFDGNGYPSGLKGDRIPLGARIIAVADSYEAMRSVRPYRDALPVKNAIEELINNMGTQFDPDIVSCFLKGLNKNKLIPSDIDIEQLFKKEG